jgi:hypothetical protein
MHGGTVTHVKLDVEGSERLALQGACDTISRHQPLLTVAIYHRPEDLFELPRLVSQLCPDHRLHIRTHNRFGLDIVLYAVPA